MPNATMTHQCPEPGRRSFLKIAGLAAAAGVLCGPAFHLAYAAALSKAQREKLTPDDIIALMKKGNERFRRGAESPHDYLAQQRASVKGQYPAAIKISGAMYNIETGLVEFFG